MQDAFTGSGLRKPLEAWITLLLSNLWLGAVCLGAVECPFGAMAPGVQISVAAYRQDGTTPVGSEFVTPGETIVLRSAIYYLPIDPLTGYMLSGVEQGKLTVTFNGLSHDVTPAGGVPVLNPFCDGVADIHSSNVVYVVSEADALAGAIVVRADYTDGVAHLATPVPVHVTAHGYIAVQSPEPVSAPGPLSIQKTAAGTILLSFAGQSQKTYRIEATTDFANWTPLGSVVPDATGLCQTEDVEAHTYSHRFYRYVVVN